MALILCKTFDDAPKQRDLSSLLAARVSQQYSAHNDTYIKYSKIGYKNKIYNVELYIHIFSTRIEILTRSAWPAKRDLYRRKRDWLLWNNSTIAWYVQKKYTTAYHVSTVYTKRIF